MVKKLVFLEADVNMPDRYGMTALHHAINNGCWEIAEYLLECKANPIVTDDSGWTPLICAVEVFNHKESTEDGKKRLEMVKKLVFLEADVNMPDRYGMTALHHAILCCLWEIAEHLLEYKANLNVTDNMGFTPLIYAAINNINVNVNGSTEDGEKRLEMVKKLVFLGADVNMSNKYGMTALHCAMKGNNNQKIIDYLRSLSPN